MTDWVLDLDIRKFFDSVPHDLMVKAVEANTDCPWVVLYVKRWLIADLALPDGTLQCRERGTPQGSAVSPILANLASPGPGRTGCRGCGNAWCKARHGNKKPSKRVPLKKRRRHG
jgi:retron-type reverse transcriptase